MYSLNHALVSINTSRPKRNGQHFADDIIKRIFFSENIWISIKISLKFVPEGPINNILALVKIMALRRPGDKPLSEPMVVSLPTHVCVTRPQCVNVSKGVPGLPFQDNQLSMLAAQQYYIEYGKEISEDGLTALLPSYIPPDKLIDEESLPKWKKQIVKTHEKLFSNGPTKTVERVKQEVVHFAKTKWPMSFSRYYDIRKLEGPEWPTEELCLAVNWTGVYVLNDGETLFEMAYPELTSVTDG